MSNFQFYMAPLQGYTDCTWRYFHHQSFGGVTNYYTPFMRVERGGLRNKDIFDINPLHNISVPTIPQILACDSDSLRIMLDKLCEWEYQEVDINLGCPFPLIARHHKGSGMLKYPCEIEILCDTLAQYKSMRFSFKMRLGYESAEDWKIILPIIEDSNPVHITMHPRIASQQYKGDVDMDEFARFYESCHAPVIYNGDVTSEMQIKELNRIYPSLKGIMIGRKLLENPAFLFQGELSATKFRVFHDNLFNAYSARLSGGDAQILTKMKTFWEYFLANADRKLIKAIKKSSNLNKYKVATENLWNNLDQSPYFNQPLVSK